MSERVILGKTEDIPIGHFQILIDTGKDELPIYLDGVYDLSDIYLTAGLLKHLAEYCPQDIYWVYNKKDEWRWEHLLKMMEDFGTHPKDMDEGKNRENESDNSDWYDVSG